jgi:flagellar basal-body rod protein FlgG
VNLRAPLVLSRDFAGQLPDGTEAYSRDGGFKLASDGRFTTSEGYPLLGGVGSVPAGTTHLTIAPTGDVTASLQTGTQSLGRLQLFRFTNAGGLDSVGGNLYRDTQASGQALAGNPGENGIGTVRQGYLEMSNVKVVEEMVNLIVAQRAYEVNAKAVQAADEMMQLSNTTPILGISVKSAIPGIHGTADQYGCMPLS